MEIRLCLVVGIIGILVCFESEIQVFGEELGKSSSDLDKASEVIDLLLESSDKLFKEDYDCDTSSNTMLKLQVFGDVLLMPNRFSLRPLVNGMMYSEPKIAEKFDKTDALASIGLDTIRFYRYANIQNKPIKALRNLIDGSESVSLRDGIRYGFVQTGASSTDAAPQYTFYITNDIEVMIWSGPTARNWELLISCLSANSIN